jgi:hypothetical protein
MTRRSALSGAFAASPPSSANGNGTSAVDFTGGFRVPYKTAGAVFRDVLGRANALRPPLGARERSVLDAVLELTTSYSKLVDSTTARRIAEIAYGVDEVDGRDRERVREILNRLDARGLIQITPCGRGRSARIIVSVSSTTPHMGMGDYDEGETQTPPPLERTPPLKCKKHPP